MDKLSQILWRERELLDTLLFRLEEERLVHASRDRRLQWRATDEVDSVLEEFRVTELMRAVVTDEVAEQIGIPAGPSLLALAAAVEEPWRSILLDHHETIASMSATIAERATEGIEDLLRPHLGRNASLVDFLS